MTANEVIWAANHEWFIKSQLLGLGYEVEVRQHTHIEGNYSVKFTDIIKLKIWAGY